MSAHAGPLVKLDPKKLERLGELQANLAAVRLALSSLVHHRGVTVNATLGFDLRFENDRQKERVPVVLNQSRVREMLEKEEREIINAAALLGADIS